MDDRRLNTLIGTACLAALLSLVAILFLTEPSPRFTDREWLTAFLALAALSVLSTMMALRISESGAMSSLDFVPQLAAVILLGPAGATTLAILSELTSEFFFYRKSLQKKFFNIAQVGLSVAAASVAYATLNGPIGLSEAVTWERSLEIFPPFLVAIVAYFGVNTSLVSYIVAVAERRRFAETWRTMTGGLIGFDIVMSLLGLGVALLYASFGPPVLFFSVVPLFGLRYSYGVNFELKQLNTDLLRLLVKTIEAQDPYTSGHSIRVSESARVIAEALRCNSKELRIVETAALLHDIGKIDVAYTEILRQKGPLSEAQRELIRAHPDRGVDILRSIRSLRSEVLECVRFHHERWDGNGYPTGISGEEIPLGARIIMICDTIDAMTTARPYRDPLPMKVVRAELQKHSGTQFDPSIVRLVLSESLLDRIEAARLKSEHDARIELSVAIAQPS
jgi:putative nucleotidyltransferase with HDIG domain